MSISPIPSELDCFSNPKLLGQGGFGAVYSAVDTRSGKEVVIKKCKNNRVKNWRWLGDILVPQEYYYKKMFGTEVGEGDKIKLLNFITAPFPLCSGSKNISKKV